MAVLVQHLLPQSPGHTEYIHNLIRSKIAMQRAITSTNKTLVLIP